MTSEEKLLEIERILNKSRQDLQEVEEIIDDLETMMFIHSPSFPSKREPIFLH